ncbi:hypothetical protein ACFVZM_10550 [Streptomyces sioyaensis]|uniref:hypothetical protein n=1 Tax=Streptomyces sioyaensis TaxID=67364 RepID=UPI00367EC666
MSLLSSADVFKSIELTVSRLHRGQLICPHGIGVRCSAGEHLTLSEAKEAAAREAADGALSAALWSRVGREAHSDVPDLARRGQLLALYFVAPCLRRSAAKVSRTLYVDVGDVRSAMVFGALQGLALAEDGDDVRNKVVRTAHDAGWAVERADPAERVMDPKSLVDRGGGYDDDCVPFRGASDVQVVDEVDSELRERISAERWGAALQQFGALESFLDAGSGPVSGGELHGLHGPRENQEGGE